MNDQDIFEFEGLKFRVHIERDDNDDAPWDREDGHGPVRFVHNINGTPSKRPGERVLHKRRYNEYYLYDWQAACKAARRDGWNAEPYDAPNRIERAVQADFDRLRRWLNDDWWYVGVCVTVEGEDGEPVPDKYEHALWGIESDCTAYIEEVAHELAGQCGREYRQMQAERIAERDEANALAADAARWRILCQHIQSKTLGTEFDDMGRPHFPTFRRFYIDSKDVEHNSIELVVDHLKEQT